jgi:hypothetical protein
MPVPPPISQYNEQEKHMMDRIQALEWAVDKMVTPLCVVLSWIVANICLAVLVIIGLGLLIGALAAIAAFFIAFTVSRNRLTRPLYN